MRTIHILAIALFCSFAVIGQTNKGGISGTVTDANGAAVPGATVTVTNLGTKQESKVTTSETGAFSVSSLEPVSYSIVVEATGFKKALVGSLKVDTATIASANIVLETGSVSEQVTITSEAALINTETGTTGQTISEREIRDLPLNTRSVLALALTAP